MNLRRPPPGLHGHSLGSSLSSFRQREGALRLCSIVLSAHRNQSTVFGRRRASASGVGEAPPSEGRFSFKPLRQLSEDGGVLPERAAPQPLPRAKRRLSFTFDEPMEGAVHEGAGGATPPSAPVERPSQDATTSRGASSLTEEESLPPLELEEDLRWSTAASSPSLEGDTSSKRRHFDFADLNEESDIDAQVRRMLAQGRSPTLAEYQTQRAREADSVVRPTDPVLRLVKQTDDMDRDAEESDLREMAQLGGQPLGSAGSTATGLRGSLSDLEDRGVAVEGEGGLLVDTMKLSPEQRHLLWEHRKKQYSVLHRKILITLESHHTLMDKALLLLELHDLVIRQRMRLRADMYEDMLHALKLAVPYFNTDLKMKPINSTTMLTEAWTMYRYALDSGTNPTPGMLDKAMSFLNSTRVASADIESKAHQIMLDVDKYRLRPTRNFLAQYYHICTRNGATHIAVMKLVEAKKKHEIAPSDYDITLILNGFRAEGRADDGLRFLSTISTVTVSSGLLEAIIHCARDSKRPMSAFSFYKSMAPAGFRPGHQILGSLLQVQEVANNYTNTLYLLNEVVRNRVQLIEVHLNMLLVALTRIRAKKEFSKLVQTMHVHGRQIHTEKFPEEFQVLVKEIGDEAARKNSVIAARGGKHSVEFRSEHQKPQLLSPRRRVGEELASSLPPSVEST